MTNPISSDQQRRTDGALGGCYQVHAAGKLPNNMNRFLHPNLQKVLFVY